MPHALYILFLFATGACVGSFLNVVVWRLPRGESLSSPPSHCPKCNQRIKWYDNVPVIGWIALGGRCRFCRESISIRYPIVEAVTGLLFVFYYCMYFLADVGPCVYRGEAGDAMLFWHAPMTLPEHWPIYVADMVMVSALLAASLIDAELFLIPIEIPWCVAVVGLVVHTIWDRPGLNPGWPGALNASPAPAALAAGAGAGLALSYVLWRTGILPTSFADGGPLLEVDKAVLAAKAEEARRTGEPLPEDPPPPEYTPRRIRAEIRKEILFLLPPLGLGFLWLLITWRVSALHEAWQPALAHRWLSALLGSLLGLLVGGFVVWFVRILGSIGFGREAMGMGDVHLMAGVGAVMGAGAVTVSFFLAPFFGLLVWAILLAIDIRRRRRARDTSQLKPRRELPFGPYLSLGAAAALLLYCPIAEWFAPGLMALMEIISRRIGG